MSVLIFFIVSYFLLSISLYLVFKKAGVNPIIGLIPGWNFVEWCKLIGRKPIYALWLLFPIVNIFIFCGMAVDLVRSFKKFKFHHSAIAVIYAPIIFTYLGLNKDEVYDGPNLPKERAYAAQLKQAREDKNMALYNQLWRDNPYKKSGPREWVESIVFAVFAAAFIRMFLIEAYVIPTPSMEGSLLVGDFLFVSKAHYGIRTPMTVAMVPLLHNVVPGLNKESYFKKPQLPYYRLKALETIDRGEPIVFNWPVGDSIFLTPQRSYAYFQVDEMAKTSMWNGDPYLPNMWAQQKYRVRPVDKKDHYIKRCVGVPGDTLQIIDSQIYINGEVDPSPSEMQLQSFLYLPQGMLTSDLKSLPFLSRNHKIDAFQQNLAVAYLTAKEMEEIKDFDERIEIIPFKEIIVKSAAFGTSTIKDSLNLKEAQLSGSRNPRYTVLRLSNDQMQILRESSEFESLRAKDPFRTFFPRNTKQSEFWTYDNYGPIYIPKEGDEVIITPNNINFYSKIIGTYENNELEIKRGRVFINGEQTTKYKFKQDYYWAMGDNRHNSEDSRVWGFVPEDHIVGKPLFIWFSLKNSKLAQGIRFKRLFRKADVR